MKYKSVGRQHKDDGDDRDDRDNVDDAEDGDMDNRLQEQQKCLHQTGPLG